MVNLNNQNLFVKGTYEAYAFDIKTGDVLYYSNKLQTSGVESSVNLGDIHAGIGNPTVIQIPDTSKLDVKATAADFSLEGRALQVGTNVAYNGITEIDEVVEAQGGKLTVSQEPCAPYGSCNIECRINKSGKGYTIDPKTREVQGFAAEDGVKYCVHYYYHMPDAKWMAVNTMFAPSVVRWMMKMPVYTKDGAPDAMMGSLYGYLYTTIPRMQFGGNVSTTGDQTNPATTVMDGTALSYDEACGNGLDCGSTAAQPKLAYQVLVPVSGDMQGVAGLVVIGGGINVGVNATVQCPVKLVMDNDQLIQPDYTKLTYQIVDTNTAEVSAAGVITGKAVGDTELIIKLTADGREFSTTCNVSVA
ncbi:hypothetical protein [uncultured Dysosmobacter sp.]|uniref:hypothetical protein n=1 Tax=uncultured Dysosmobacter sp. TaxID=2591384 RepID=UPI00262E1D63|nr:hypothetical protein [uncultured Dysosmobacter sp.]